jgi:hypothetical protein
LSLLRTRNKLLFAIKASIAGGNQFNLPFLLLGEVVLEFILMEELQEQLGV